ncbi:MAG: cytoplasmic protein [Deltaproteobacteria bacterium]|nr:cytoplasmic protein [Deltaproteobacteria bacterium]
MAKHSHTFVETYNGLLGFGLDRKIDENTVIVYLQKLSDDNLMAQLRDRLSDQELSDIFNFVSTILKRHLTEPEYHQHFLKE